MSSLAKAARSTCATAAARARAPACCARAVAADAPGTRRAPTRTSRPRPGGGVRRHGGAAAVDDAEHTDFRNIAKSGRAFSQRDAMVAKLRQLSGELDDDF